MKTKNVKYVTIVKLMTYVYQYIKRFLNSITMGRQFEDFLKEFILSKQM